MTYDLCCSRFRTRVRQDVEVPSLLSSLRSHKEHRASPLKVDLVVRTWHKDLPQLEGLLRSIAIFWPFGRLKTTVHVVLDAEAPQTTETCRWLEDRFGSWLRCVGEELPEFLREATLLRRPKFARVHWSSFWADKYASPEADFVGICDSDVVFHSFGADAMLFAPPVEAEGRIAEQFSSPQLPRPVLSGSWSATFAFSVLAIQDQYFGVNFMDTLPMLVRRADFEALRSYLRERFRRLSGQPDRPLTFDEAFVLAEQYVDTWATGIGWFQAFQGESLTFHSAMGAFLWVHRREHYFFSVQAGAQLGLPATAACPSLRPAHHVTNLKRAAYDNPRKVSYENEARGIIAAGLCAAAGIHRRLLPRDAKLCAAAAYQADELLVKPDDVGSRAWTATDSDHCGRRSLARLLADYQSLLLEGHGASPSLALLRWALGGNASGEYDPNARGPSDRLEVFDQQGRET